MKTGEKKPTKEGILKMSPFQRDDDNEIWYSEYDVLKAMQEYAKAYHKEKLRDILDKVNCLTGYLERWLNNPLSVPPFELKDVINESKEWINEYLKTIE